MDRERAREALLACFAAAVAAVDPEQAVLLNLQIPPVRGRIVILALGKAAPAMTRGAAAALAADGLEGIAVSNHHDHVPPGIELRIASHPVPDGSSVEAGRALLDLADTLTAEDLAIVLISGGGSALAEVPVPGVSIADIATTNELLLRSGADIVETNTIRRRLSVFKGGGLAAAIAPARSVTLIVSDVVGDAPITIASGPTVASNEPAEEALDVVARLSLEGRLPESVMAALRQSPVHRAIPAEQSLKVIASGAVAAHGAAQAAERLGFSATVVDTRLTGAAAEAAGEVLQRSGFGISIFAGETTVLVTGDGHGGRNQEAALVVATLIDGLPDVHFLAAGTDGRDGTTMAAGAYVDGNTVRLCRGVGLDANEVLDRNDSGSLFAAIGDQIVTGPTGTNVGDIWLVLRS